MVAAVAVQQLGQREDDARVDGKHPGMRSQCGQLYCGACNYGGPAAPLLDPQIVVQLVQVVPQQGCDIAGDGLSRGLLLDQSV